MIYVETGDHSAGGVVYKVKRGGPNVEPCVPPHESVNLFEKISFLQIDFFIQIRRNLNLIKYSIPI